MIAPAGHIGGGRYASQYTVNIICQGEDLYWKVKFFYSSMNIYFKATFCIVKEIINIPGSCESTRTSHGP
jgi:hypothetical protein